MLAELVDHTAVHEAVAISTCNRTEPVPYPPTSRERRPRHPLAPGRPATHRAARRDLLAARDRGRSTCSRSRAGLDSMIVGEAEVQGQVKRLHELALVEGVTGPVSNRLFRDALATGKRVRSETSVSRSNVSVSSVAVRLAATSWGTSPRSACWWWARVRTPSHRAGAQRARGGGLLRRQPPLRPRLGLAQRFGGRAVSFDDMPQELEQADIVSATGAPHQIVGRDELEYVAASRMGRPLVLLDLAVPRDIDPDVRNCPGSPSTTWTTSSAVARNLSVETEADEACARSRGSRALRHLAGLADVVPTISALRRRDEIVDQLLRENESGWEAVDGRPRASGRDGPRRGQPAAARADAAPQGLGRRGDLVPVRERVARAVRSRGGARATRGGARLGHPAGGPPPLGRPVTIRLWTRGSKLALTQANWVAERLDGEVELVTVRTSGTTRRTRRACRTKHASSRNWRRPCSLGDRPGRPLGQGRARRAAGRPGNRGRARRADAGDALAAPAASMI